MAAVRRVVSRPGGIASDGVPPFVVTSADGGPDVAMIWSTDGTATVPAGETDPTGSLTMEQVFPGAGGTRFMLVDHPPGSGVTGGHGGTAADLEELGIRDDGMHATDTVDYVVVVSGTICLDLGDAGEVELSAGDCFVQNGTVHAWRNRSDQPSRVAVVLIGAHRS